MGQLSSTQLFQFILAVTLMLGLGKTFGEFFRKLKQAPVVGEIIAGIIMGPTVIGYFFPEFLEFVFPSNGPVSYSLEALSQLGILFLLLAVGLEVDLAILFKYGKSALIVTAYSMIFPFVLGFSIAFFAPQFFVETIKDNLIFAFFLGTALSISALPIIARTLLDLNLFRSKLGMMIIASAMLNDLIGWIAFSIFLSFAEKQGTGIPVMYSVVLILFFTAVVIFFVRKLFNRIIPWVQSELSWPGGIIGFIMVMGLIGALITDQLGMHTILGAFIMGVALGDSVHLKQSTREIIQQFITNIFAPLFFVYIGLKVNFVKSFDPATVIIILILGFAGKIIGAGLGAHTGGFSKNESFAVGFAMNSRGVLEIILSLFALELGIINEQLFVGVIFLVVVSSVLSGPLIKLSLAKEKTKGFLQLLQEENVLFSSANTKEKVIKELTTLACKNNRLDFQTVYKKVWEREQIISTSIGMEIAIPHGRIDIKKPIIAAAINKKGVDFDSPDGLPSKIIFLLLTPQSNNELQLQLLAEIANFVSIDGIIEQLIQCDTKEEFIAILQNQNLPEAVLTQ